MTNTKKALQKSDIVAHVADTHKLTNVQAEAIVSSVFDTITQNLSEGRDVAIRGLFTAKVRPRKVATAFGGKSAERVTRNVISIKASQVLKPQH